MSKLVDRRRRIKRRIRRQGRRWKELGQAIARAMFDAANQKSYVRLLMEAMDAAKEKEEQNGRETDHDQESQRT